MFLVGGNKYFVTRCISVFALAARKLGVEITALLKRAAYPQYRVSYSL